jgi:hypothetical protein
MSLLSLKIIFILIIYLRSFNCLGVGSCAKITTVEKFDPQRVLKNDILPKLLKFFKFIFKYTGKWYEIRRGPKADTRLVHNF